MSNGQERKKNVTTNEVSEAVRAFVFLVIATATLQLRR